ncbi:hypothetical protein [Tabrizicola sp.]|uniref:hypothetical protein n=1 Tax=Tabrizicola sp. TaxID=2005166 RepID=UPI0026228B5E|nr:hypothetical protein [Tabrizicola sp.]MDM7933714.1 hypothetical protein [Tabrizicola sp.]
MTGRPEVHFHINPREAGSWRGRERLAIYTRLAELCEAHGLVHRAFARPADEMKPQEGVADGNLHIVENGRMRGEGWLNTALAYIKGFWHLDPRGIQAESCAREAVFAREDMDKAAALAFMRQMRRRFVAPRLSRFNQPRTLATGLPDGAVALFLQGRSAYHAGRCRLPMGQMILAVAQGAGGRPVIVKPHPQALELGAEAMAAALAAGARFEVTDANVHDVLAAASVTVSVNSAVAMEGFLHRKPAILFGESDFPSLVTRAQGADDFPQALEAALSARWPYARMLHWYFSHHTLELAAPGFEAQVFAAFDRVGFPRDRLGV